MIKEKFYSVLQKLVVLAIGFLVVSCATSEKEDGTIPISIPEAHSSSEPSLHKSDDGTIYLSWIETDTSKVSHLRFSTFESKATWSSPTTIASGNDWFVNWADFPSLTSFGSNLAAHYLAKSADGTYTYDVNMKLSNDKGKTWNDAFVPHTDGTHSEHGFVSKVALNANELLSVWLDGRQYAYAEKDSTITKEMTLRAATMSSANQLVNEFQLDDRVCDCCQTDTAMTMEGPIVVYRDRTSDEIRDISYVKMVNGQWSEPQPIFNDGWHIEGCPVNGPAISTKTNYVAVAWYTAAQSQPRVKLAFSEDNGQSFGDPIEVDHQKSIGRLDLELLDDNSALVCWMDNLNEETVILLQKVFADGTKSKRYTVASSSESRSSGFPRIAIDQSHVIVAFTTVLENKTMVKTKRLPLDILQ